MPPARAPVRLHAGRRLALAAALLAQCAIGAAGDVVAEARPSATAVGRQAAITVLGGAGGDVTRVARPPALRARRATMTAVPPAATLPAFPALAPPSLAAARTTFAAPESAPPGAPAVAPITARAAAGARPSTRDAADTMPRTRAGEDARAPLALASHAASAVARRAAPRSFLVISLAVPAELPLDREVRYTIVGTGASRLYGRLTGALAAGVARPDSLLVTVGVPARALAGPVVVGHVRFQAGELAVESPLAIEVDAVPQVQLTAAQSLRAVVAGGRTVVSYTAVNDGNVPDTVDVQLELPAGWRASGPRVPARAAGDRAVARHPLGVRQAVRGEVELTVPVDAARGPVALRVHARGALLAAAVADVTVEVIDSEQTGGLDGPRAVVRAATASGTAPGTAPGVALTIDGPVGDGVFLSARAGTAPAHADGATLALAGLGVYRMAPSLALTAERWSLGAGLTEHRQSDLTGASIAGSGVSASLVRPRWRGGFLAARPQLGLDRSGGVLLAARASTVMRAATFTGSLSHLAERGNAGRRLDALSVAAEMVLPTVGPVAIPGRLGEFMSRSLDGPLGGAIRGSALAGEVGYRGHANGSGLGWAASVARRGERGSVDLRVAHAPGGSAAFARSAQELTGTATRLLSSRLSVSSSAWASADRHGALDALDSRGAEIGAQLRASSAVSVSTDVRRSSWEVTSGDLRFGGSEVSVVGTLTARRGRAYATAGVLGGPETRETLLPNGVTSSTSSTRAQLRGGVGTGVGTGTVSLDGRAEWSAMAGGLPVRQSDLALRAERVRLARVGPARAYVDASIRRYRIGADAPSLALRGAGRIELPRALALVAAVERNPFFVTRSGRPGWTYALGVERATQLPRFGATPPAHGVVFQDLDDDGVRDPGESGFAQVVVRGGASTGVTAADGTFAMPARRGGDVERADLAIDPLSLPVGFITGRRSDHHGRVELAAVAVTPVEVRLALSAADSARVGPEQLTRAVVVAKDSLGRPWIARAVSPGVAVFDALPPGRYRVDVELSALTEPLHLADAPPEVVVTGGRELLRVTLTLRGRPIRIRQASPSAPAPPAEADLATASGPST